MRDQPTLITALSLAESPGRFSVTSKPFLQFETRGHPESASRISAITRMRRDRMIGETL